MSRTIKTKVVGVTQKNEDGDSRQEIIDLYVEPGDELFLDREYSNEVDYNAVAVYHGPMNQIGYIKSVLAAELSEIMAAGQLITASVIEKTGGDEEKSFGVNIELVVFTPEETAIIKKREQEIINRYEFRIQQLTGPAPVATQKNQNPTKALTSTPHQVTPKLPKRDGYP